MQTARASRANRRTYRANRRTSRAKPSAQNKHTAAQTRTVNNAAGRATRAHINRADIADCVKVPRKTHENDKTAKNGKSPRALRQKRIKQQNGINGDKPPKTKSVGKLPTLFNHFPHKHLLHLIKRLTLPAFRAKVLRIRALPPAISNSPRRASRTRPRKIKPAFSRIPGKSLADTGASARNKQFAATRKPHKAAQNKTRVFPHSGQKSCGYGRFRPQ